MVKRILIADDEAPSRYAATVILEKSGYDCVEASGACMVMELLRENSGSSTPIDLILLDWHMPGCLDLELISELGQIENCPPVVVMSGTLDAGELMELYQKNSFGVISKPFVASKLLRVIADIFAGKR